VSLLQKNILPFLDAAPFSFQRISRGNPASASQTSEITRNSSSLGGCFGHHFSSPLCGMGSLPPFWRGMRAALLVVKGLFRSLPLLSWELCCESWKQRDPHQKQQEGLGVSTELGSLTQTGTNCDRLHCAALVVVSVVSRMSQTTPLSGARCTNSVKLICKPVASLKKSQNEEDDQLDCVRASASPVPSARHLTLSLPVLTVC